MAYIKINYDGVTSMTATIKKAINELNDIEDDIRSIRMMLPAQISSRYQIEEKLVKCQNSSCEAKLVATQLMDSISSALNKYKQTEAKLLRELL